jgi:hypothetical protein
MASNKVGRPTVFTPDAKDLILEYIEAGYSNTAACQMVGVDVSNLYLTISRDPSFRERYDAAKLAAVDALVDEAHEAAREARRSQNGTEVAGAKLFVDTQKWAAARLAPNRWGEKASITVNSQVSDDPQELAKRLAFLQALQGGEDEEGPEDNPEA